MPHHLIDIAEPTDNFTAGDYARVAADLSEIEARGTDAILVGGTGFYLRALVQPLFEGPKTDLRLRERLIVCASGAGESTCTMLSRLDAQPPRGYSRATGRV